MEKNKREQVAVHDGAQPHGAELGGSRHVADHMAAAPFKERVHEALRDDRLQGAVRTATDRLSRAYGHVAAQVPEAAELRHQAADIRRHTLVRS